jgi:hypothetical protein
MLQVHDRSVDCGDHARPARGRFVEWGVPFLLLLLPVFAMQLTPGLLPGGPLMLVLTAFAIGTRAATDPPLDCLDRVHSAPVVGKRRNDGAMVDGWMGRRARPGTPSPREQPPSCVGVHGALGVGPALSWSPFRRPDDGRATTERGLTEKLQQWWSDVSRRRVARVARWYSCSGRG